MHSGPAHESSSAAQLSIPSRISGQPAARHCVLSITTSCGGGSVPARPALLSYLSMPTCLPACSCIHAMAPAAATFSSPLRLPPSLPSWPPVPSASPPPPRQCVPPPPAAGGQRPWHGMRTSANMAGHRHAHTLWATAHTRFKHSSAPPAMPARTLLAHMHSCPHACMRAHPQPLLLLPPPLLLLRLEPRALHLLQPVLLRVLLVALAPRGRQALRLRARPEVDTARQRSAAHGSGWDQCGMLRMHACTPLAGT